MLGGTTNAADKKQTALQNSVERKTVYTVKTASALSMSYAALQEENLNLKLQTAELNGKLDELTSKLDYTQMMHTVLTNLQQQELINTVENAKSQLDYASMMNTTLLNLASVKGK
jgi:hypothetical protein